MPSESPATPAQNEAQTIANLAVQNVPRRHFMKDPDPHGFVVFEDKTIRSLEAYAAHPKRKRASVKLIETKSFIDYVIAHKMPAATHLFGVATEAGGSFTAVLDFHTDERASMTPDDSRAAWGEHIALLTLETTPEWRRWLKYHNVDMSQEQFAEFIEDNALDIIAPDAASLLETAQLLTGKKNVTFRSGKNLRNGSIDFQFTETIEETGGKRNDTMQVPDKIKLGLIPFVGAIGIEIEARLRFRISDSGKLSFKYILNRPYLVIENAFSAARAEIEGKTGLHIHIGTASITNPTVQQ